MAGRDDEAHARMALARGPPQGEASPRPNSVVVVRVNARTAAPRAAAGAVQRDGAAPGFVLLAGAMEG
jgi:hypothetical protein